MDISTTGLSSIGRLSLLYGAFGASAYSSIGDLAASARLYPSGSVLQSSLTNFGVLSSNTDTVQLSSLGQTQSALAGLQQALKSLTVAAVQTPIAATSSNSKILTATADANRVIPAGEQVTVNQLATGQTVESAHFANAEAVIGSGRLSFQFGNVSGNILHANGSAVSVVINPGDASLSGIANSINHANVGVTAKVLSDSTGSWLSLSSTQTGINAAFSINVSDDKGVAGGLSQLAFSPVSNSNGLTLKQAAQNANVTAGSRTLASTSNQVSDTATGTTLNLQATGTATLSFARDTKAIGQSVQSLVNAYNAAQSSLGQLGGLQASQSLTRLARALDQTQAGSGTARVSLADLGITHQQNGSLALDTTKLNSALQRAPDSVGEWLGNAAQALNRTAQAAQTSNFTAAIQVQRSSFASSLVQAQQQTSTSPLFSGTGYQLNSRTLYGLQQYLNVSLL